ncbi:hypothetical protein NPIL_645591 [Nephila pilipes]|uniref:Uncharacterized protein n=1 Tax=Nephila pilipes TaxID=299642 RepID=A0A8X6P4J4_NEPPI|nr:hypothetical protein NPIL_645591 [Nephila pilipes]
MLGKFCSIGLFSYFHNIQYSSLSKTNLKSNKFHYRVRHTHCPKPSGLCHWKPRSLLLHLTMQEKYKVTGSKVWTVRKILKKLSFSPVMVKYSMQTLAAGPS